MTDQSSSSSEWHVLQPASDQADMTLSHTDLSPSEDDAYAIFTGASTPSVFPVRKAELGTQLADYVIAPAPYTPVISYNFAQVLANARISGWGVYPVRVDGCPAGCTLHFGLVVRGRCGPIDHGRATPGYELGPDGPLGPVPIGLWFDETTWDGHDVFSPSGEFIVFVSSNARNVLQSSGLTGFELVPQSRAFDFSDEAIRLLQARRVDTQS